MGVDYYAITVIGIRVARSEIFRTVKKIENCCKCDKKIDPPPNSDIKYCPICGRPIKLEVEEEFCILPGLAEQGYIEEVRGWPVKCDTDCENFFIGPYAMGPIDGWKKGPLPDLSEETLDRFRQDMRELGLWRQDRFGLWTILQCSY
jgi:hypothetical protein